MDRQKCLLGHVCLLLQVATWEGQLAVPMERRRGPNKRWREKENQLNLCWPSEATQKEPSPPNPQNETVADFYLLFPFDNIDPEFRETGKERRCEGSKIVSERNLVKKSIGKIRVSQ